MDASSIITQVKAEDDENRETTSTCNGGPATLSEQDIIVHPCYKLQNEPEGQGVKSSVKKPRNRGILSSIFCCFGAHQSTSRPVAKTTEHPSGWTAAVTNDNTLPKGYEEDDPSGEDDLLERLQPSPQYLLAPASHEDVHRNCAVIDLDETLVHSSFKPVQNPDFIVPVEIDGTVHQVYVLKRPFVDEFLKRMGELYECVLFTASLAKYADPVADLLDKYGTFRARLFRESCVFHEGNYVKDLSRLGRNLEHVIIIDNSPASYIFHPENAVPVRSWFDDQDDKELLNLLPFLDMLHSVDDCVVALQNNRNRPRVGSTSYHSNGTVER